MDLFNRKALALAGERFSEIREIAKQAQDESYKYRQLYDKALEAFYKAGDEKHEFEIKNAVLTERLDLLTSGVLDAKPAPAAWTEDVEDAEFLFRTGRLDRGEFEAALEAAGFANTEIEFDSASLPQI